MASVNLFDLLQDDATDASIVVPAAPKAAAKPAKAAAAPAAAAADNKARNARPAGKDGARGANKPREEGARGPRFDRNPREDRAPRGDSHRGGRPPRAGRREHDRHSATGIVDSEKKENKGWGEPTTDPLVGEQAAAAELSADAAAAAPAEPVEPEVVYKTLDDYLAEKAAKALKVSLPETRAANAGADESQWKNAAVLETPEAEDFIKLREETVAKKSTKTKTAKVTVEMDFKFSTPAKEPSAPRGAFGGRGRGGDRGARGGDRRGAPRGAARAPRASAANVDTNDTSLFPSLGSK